MKIRKASRLLRLIVLVIWPPQLDFLIGDWNVLVTLYQGEGEPLVYEAKWHNHWVADGYVVMQEWRGPYVTGIELRTFDPGAGYWHGRNIYYPRPAAWYENTARFEDSQLIVTERSNDGGKSWNRGRYELIATR